MINRKLATTNLEFGIITIPVAIHKYGKEHDVSMNFIAECHDAPVKYVKVCSECGKEQTGVRRGVYVGDRLVIFTDEEVKALEEEKTNLVVKELVSIDKFDWSQIESIYTLNGDEKMKTGKVLGSFVEALRRLGAFALGEWVFRGKKRMFAILPKDNGALLVTLRWKDERGEVIPLEYDENLVKRAISIMSEIHAQPTETYVDTRYEKFKEILEKKLGGVLSGSTEDLFKKLGKSVKWENADVKDEERE